MNVMLFTAIASFVLVIYRLHLGVDFTDEAYYAAMAMRFIQGDIPFRDELFVNQTAVLIVLPAVRLFHSLFGTEGIILFLRGLYFLFCSGVSAVAYRVFRKHGSAATAGAAALLAVVFIPFNIPTLSYNTLGGGLFALAIFLILLAEERETRWPLAPASLAAALAAFAYPPLLLASIAMGGIFIYHRKRNRISLALLWSWGHLAVGLWAIPYLIRAGDGLVDSMVYTWTAHHHGGGWHKLLWIVGFWTPPLTAYRLLLALVTAPLALMLRARRPQLAAISLTLFAPLLFWAYSDAIFPSEWFFGYFALSAPFFYFTGERNPFQRNLFRLGWIPSFVAGLLSAWSSSSSPGNLIVGMWGGGMISFFLLLQAIEFLVLSSPSRFVRGLPALTQHAVVIGLLGCLFVGTVFYCDGPFGAMTAEVTSGPFAGLVTTPSKREYLTEITRDIQALENEHGKIVFYEFPAGYLLTSMRVGVNSAWMRTESLGKGFYVRHYQKQWDPQNLVFAIRKIDHGFPSPIPYPSDDAFVKYLRESHHLILNKENYQVFAPTTSSSSHL